MRFKNPDGSWTVTENDAKKLEYMMELENKVSSLESMVSTIPILPDNPTLKQCREYQMSLINVACNAEILQGFDSDCNDPLKGQQGHTPVMKHYSFSYDDQINMAGIQLRIATEIPLLGKLQSPIEWKDSTMYDCKEWGVERFVALCRDAEAFKTRLIKRYGKVKKYVYEKCKTKEEVLSVTWDIQDSLLE